MTDDPGFGPGIYAERQRRSWPPRGPWAGRERENFPFAYFALVLLLSVPFWVLGAGTMSKALPIDLPVSALTAFVPMTAALILTVRADGAAGARNLLVRVFDARRIPNLLWVFAALLIMPATMLCEYAILRFAGTRLPAPQISVAAIPAFFAMFFVGAVGEELGWQGYAYDRLETRWNPLGAALFLGLVWAAWHVIPFFQTHRSTWWIEGQLCTAVVTRVVVAWLYLNGGRSVFLSVVFHTMINVSEFLFPVYGSHYDPWIAFGILSVLSAIVALVCSKPLGRFRLG